ncbi:hypothetical protein CFK37_04760 [Virgibacillus phasianinus]|uniref:DUF2935 domain-containing protein n=1 Tax=Virgibacillus phasianinus TaxID=2017483 RepID=A0A220U0S2_9BACI|nr:DUF2935 domain-containing protein [Virgibacillus phasianinus]ASK61533.1 hypothetical protein CFK37_04760 [Virgibacillus phasianinus]
MSDYQEVSLYENRFWLQILGDHARFIYSALAPDEKEYIHTAEKLKNVFDQLLERARTSLSGDALLHFNQYAYQQANEIRKFKLELIKEHLIGQITIHLTPSFLNHMVNEVDEYIRILEYLCDGKVPPISHEVHHHLLWLLDAAGHAGAINDTLDSTEQMLKEKTHKFTKTFNHFYLKAIEMAGFLRTYVQEFPALERFNYQAELEMKIFKEFLRELEEMELQGSVLDTFSALMADHMAREECYYLIKLAQSRGLETPSCDPAKPRVTES